MSMKLCPANKHYYDPGLHPECPYCNEGTQPTARPVSAGKTQPVSAAAVADAPKTQPVAGLRQGAVPASAAEGKTVVMGAAGRPASAADAGHLPVVGWLVVAEGPGRGRDFRLVQGENRIGRQQGLEVCLDFGSAADAAVSREAHAVVVFDHHAREFFIERGSSRNLPLLNGTAIRGEPTLRPFDVIQVGNTKLLFVPLCHSKLNWDDGLLAQSGRL